MEAVKRTLDISHYRSRKRIKDYGEVFTPKKYVQQMLDILDKSVWSDEKIVFFEPTCGHGNFVEGIVQRRLDAFFKKAKKKKINKPHYYVIANTINNLWAIDIDRKNIEYCRGRVWNVVLAFFLQHEKTGSLSKHFSYNKDFLAHILCCIRWQIHENEMLSCLEEDGQKAKLSASKTQVGHRWFSNNRHKPIDFELTWCEYFTSLKNNNIGSFEFKRALRFITALTNGLRKGSFSEFSFAHPHAYMKAA